MICYQINNLRTSLKLGKVCFVALLLLVCVLLYGCPIFSSYGHPDVVPPMLWKIDEYPNTFRMAIPRMFRRQEDWVKAVRVTDLKEAYKGNICVYWEVRAQERVSMHGFEVEVGCVPDGFEQTVPAGGVKFTPEAGKFLKYLVAK